MKMKKIVVNSEACIGCGACVAIDPEHFAFNDEGLSHAIVQDNFESAELNNAIDSCPTSAISISECTCQDNKEESDTTCECEDCECEECKCEDCECNHEEE